MEIFDYIYKKDNSFIIGYSDKIQYTLTNTSFLFKTFRIVYIKGGKVDWKIGNEIHTLKAGDVILLNNILPRRIMKIYNNKPLCYDLFGFSPHLLTDPIILNLFYSNHGYVVRSENGISNKVHLLLNELYSEISSDNRYKLELIKNLLYVTLINIARSIDISNIEPTSINNAQIAITEIIQYIQNNLTANLNVSALAIKCGYSNEHFSRLFKKYIGISVISYISNARIENTLHLINNENLNILSAAMQSGFNTSSGFYKAFKKHKNSSPSKYSIKK